MVPVIVEAPHDCGMCNGYLSFTGQLGNSFTFTCRACGWWHISRDCCTDEINDAIQEIRGF